MQRPSQCPRQRHSTTITPSARTPRCSIWDVPSVMTPLRGFHSPGSRPWPPLSVPRRETTAQHAPASKADKRVPTTHGAPPKTQPTQACIHTSLMVAEPPPRAQRALPSPKSLRHATQPPQPTTTDRTWDIPNQRRGCCQFPLLYSILWYCLVSSSQDRHSLEACSQPDSQPGRVWEAHLSGYLAAIATSWKSGLTYCPLILTRDQHLN